MKRLMTFVASAALCTMVSVSAMAAPEQTASTMTNSIGVVDMQQVYENSPKIKKLSETLKEQFSKRRDSIVQMGKELQAQIQKYQKEKPVLSQKDLTTLQKKIREQQVKLREAQVSFQQDLFSAQSKEMKNFITKVRGVVKTIATQKHLSVVLAKNNLLYANHSLDITKTVIDKIKD